MICKKCGNEVLGENAAFCNKCGAPIEPTIGEKVTEVVTQQPKKKSKLPFVILGVCVLLAAAIGGGVYYYYNSPSYVGNQHLEEAYRAFENGDYKVAGEEFKTANALLQKDVDSETINKHFEKRLEDIWNAGIFTEETLAAMQTVYDEYDAFNISLENKIEVDASYYYLTERTEVYSLFALEQAKNLEKNGDLDTAFAMYKEFYTNSEDIPENIREDYLLQIKAHLFSCADAWFSQGEYDKADEEYDYIFFIRDLSDELFIKKSNVILAKNDVEGAVSYLNHCLYSDHDAIQDRVQYLIENTIKVERSKYEGGTRVGIASYDEKGRISSEIHVKEQERSSYTYYENGNLESKKRYDSKSTEPYAEAYYDEDGHLLRKTSGTDYSESNEYQNGVIRKKVVISSGNVTTTNYDEKGRKTEAVTGTGTTQFIYDGSGLSKVIKEDGTSINFTSFGFQIFDDGSCSYDEEGRLTYKSTENVNYYYSYNELNQLTTVTGYYNQDFVEHGFSDKFLQEFYGGRLPEAQPAGCTKVVYELSYNNGLVTKIDVTRDVVYGVYEEKELTREASEKFNIWLAPPDSDHPDTYRRGIYWGTSPETRVEKDSYTYYYLSCPETSANRIYSLFELPKGLDDIYEQEYAEEAFGSSEKTRYPSAVSLETIEHRNGKDNKSYTYHIQNTEEDEEQDSDGGINTFGDIYRAGKYNYEYVYKFVGEI